MNSMYCIGLCLKFFLGVMPERRINLRRSHCFGASIAHMMWPSKLTNLPLQLCVPTQISFHPFSIRNKAPSALSPHPLFSPILFPTPTAAPSPQSTESLNSFIF
ncbi:hypothetical protein I3843_11G155600 [Carya illinoinensis]|nr:hypothetical protein I3843_11G155600 [Carya illinoinensis]